jgi:hypothetical protein
MCVTNTTTRRNQPVVVVATNLSASLAVVPKLSFETERYFTVESTDGYPVNKTFPDAPKPQAKERSKRRRKPQQPGKTAKMNDRHFVQHNYHDHALDAEDTTEPEPMEVEDEKRRGGVATSFPLKLHEMLDQIEADGLAGVISWQPHGRAFLVHKPAEFVSTVMPKYFRQTKLTSFQRQLNLYGFCRLTRGADNRGYYHELFLRGKPFLTKHMVRTKVKGTGFKGASSPDQEPDLYSMPPVAIVTPQVSSHEDSQESNSDDASNATFSVGASQVQPPLPYGSKLCCSPGTPDYPPNTIVTSNSFSDSDAFVHFRPMSPIDDDFNTLYQPVPETAPTSQDPLLDDSKDILSWTEAPQASMMLDFAQAWNNVDDSEIQIEEAIESDELLGCLLERFLADVE